MAKYEYLPGVDIATQDGGLILPEDTTTESMLIIAPSLAENAPEEPVLVRQSSELVSSGFGDFYVGGIVNPIAAEWKSAQDAGNRRVYLLALKGKTEKEQFLFLHELLFGVLADFSVDHVVLTGATVDKEIEGLVADDFVSNEEVQLEFPHVPGIRITGNSVISEEILSLPIEIKTGTNDTITLSVKQADGTSKDSTITLKPGKYDGVTLKAEDLVKDVQTELEKLADVKGRAYTSNGHLAIMLDKEFSVKASTATDLGFKVGAASKVVKDPLGVIVRGNFGKLLGDYAENQTLIHNSVITYIGVGAAREASLKGVKEQVDRLMKLDNEYSGHLQVIAHEVGILLPLTNQLYFLNGATHYAALISQLRPESAPTNKVLKGVRVVRYNYSLRQLNLLTGKRYVTFRLKNGSLIVTDGCTTAPKLELAGVTRDSDYVRLSTVRITQEAIKVVRGACEPFIGEPNQMPQYNALNTSIKGALEAMRAAGALSDYKFTVVAESGTLDAAKVTLLLVPMFELRRISVEIGLRPPQSYTGISL